MKTEEAILPALGGLAAGVLGTLVLQPASLRRALYATANSDLANGIGKTLDTNGIPNNISAPASDLKTVTLGGENRTTLYVVVVSDQDFQKASNLILGTVA